MTLKYILSIAIHYKDVDDMYTEAFGLFDTYSEAETFANAHIDETKYYEELEFYKNNFRKNEIYHHDHYYFTIKEIDIKD